MTTGQISNIKVIKPIAWGLSITGKNILITNHFVDAAPDNYYLGQTTSFPSNTDGIGISGTNVTVDGYYGLNGDDCINITDGGHDIVAKNGYCGFASHGLSVGSLGQDGATASVANVLFQNWTMDNAMYAARVRGHLTSTYLPTDLASSSKHGQGVRARLTALPGKISPPSMLPPLSSLLKSTVITLFVLVWAVVHVLVLTVTLIQIKDLVPPTRINIAQRSTTSVFRTSMAL